jgi:tRNA-specific 2-thiouridylase
MKRQKKRYGKMKKSRNKKVVIAMSGGLDSSVAAALLKKAGFETIGVFMKFWSEPVKDGLIGAWNRCCSPEAEKRARSVANILDIPFYVFNFEKEFKKRIVDYFLKEYQAGRTPNPCVVCNKEIKFGLCLEKALALDADYVATGHYARLKKKGGRIHLLRGKDKKKDQSYFLWQLSQNQLKHILFPLGEYTKRQVRALAKKLALPVLNLPESQEVCFISTTLNDFLARHIRQRPGKIIDTKGKTVGQHQGLAFYTIGQRRGLELTGGPFYVVGKDLKQNVLIVAPFFDEQSLYGRSLIAEEVNWISGKKPKLPLKIKAQIRYLHKAVSATITKRLKGGKIELIFVRSQRAITPGQSVVFYSSAEASAKADQDQEVLGGGIIS